MKLLIKNQTSKKLLMKNQKLEKVINIIRVSQIGTES